MKSITLLLLAFAQFSLSGQFTQIGNPDFAGTSTINSRLQIDNNNVPHLMHWYQSPGGTDPYAVNFMMLDTVSNLWVNEGPADYNAGGRLHSTMNSLGEVVVLCEATVDSLEVRKFSGGSWVPIGPRIPSGFGSGFNSIVLDTNDVPYVAVLLNGTDFTILRYNGIDWEQLGMSNFCFPAAFPESVDLAIDN